MQVVALLNALRQIISFGNAYFMNTSIPLFTYARVPSYGDDELTVTMVATDFGDDD